MDDEKVRAHLKAALEAVTEGEEARVRGILDDSDQRIAEQIAAMGPVFALLSALQEEVGPHKDISFRLADAGHMATLETKSSTSRDRITVGFDVKRKSYRLECTNSYSFAGGGSNTEVIFASTPDDAMKPVIEMLGKHLGAERAHRHRSP